MHVIIVQEYILNMLAKIMLKLTDTKHIINGVMDNPPKHNTIKHSDRFYINATQHTLVLSN